MGKLMGGETSLKGGRTQRCLGDNCEPVLSSADRNAESEYWPAGQTVRGLMGLNAFEGELHFFLQIEKEELAMNCLVGPSNRRVCRQSIGLTLLVAGC